MGVSVRYDEQGRLLISDLSCACGCEHHPLDQHVYVGTGLLRRVPAYVRQRGLGARCVLVADNITYELAGRAVQQALEAEGFSVIPCVICRPHAMEPDERACGEVLLSVQPDTEFLVSVGSGSLTDTTRAVSARIGLPFVCVGTAASMDGYTSTVAPVLLRGLKIHRAGRSPEIIVCDLDVLRTAPLEMVQSGVGDLLGKYIARVDWLVSSIINDEPYCPTCAQIVMEAVDKLLHHTADIRARSEQGIRVLIEALLLAGMTATVIGSTRPVGSLEHNIAHYWEMEQLSAGNPPPAHGMSVGVSTMLLWPIYQRFATEDLSRLNLEEIRAGRMERAERERFVIRAFGEEGGRTIIRENPEDFITWAEQERRVRRAQERFADLSNVLRELPPLRAVRQAMETLGAPLTAEEIGVGEALRNLSLHCAKDYRSRFSLFKLLDACGLLREYLREYPL